MTLDQVELVLAWTIGVLLFVSALLTLIRITRGPSVLDRAVASDVLVTIAICAIGVQAALTRLSTTLPLLVSLSLVGFLGSVAVARFVARDKDAEDGGSAVGPLQADPEQADSWLGDQDDAGRITDDRGAQ